MENKRVAAIALVMAVAFGGICYGGYGRYKDLKTAQAKISEIRNKVEDFTSASITPKPKNRDLITQAAKDAKGLKESMYADLLNYATFCMAGQGAQSPAPAAEGGEAPAPAPVGVDAYRPVTHPAQFQANLKGLIGSLSRYAAEKGCELGLSSGGEATSVDKFGNYSHFENAVPTQEDVSYYNFLLYAANETLRHIIDAGAPSIKKIYFRELPDAAARKDKYVRLSFEVAFTAKRSELVNPANPDTQSVLPKVINKLTHDKKFFFIPTGVSVTTRENLPSAGAEAFVIAAEATADSEEEENEAAAQERVSIVALPQTGKSSDTVDVYLTLQVLYFTSDKF